jgi:hypothetical protein
MVVVAPGGFRYEPSDHLLQNPIEKCQGKCRKRQDYDISKLTFLQQQRFLAAPVLIPAHSKAIRVEGTGGFEAQPALVGLVCNTVYRPCDQLRVKENRL